MSRKVVLFTNLSHVTINDLFTHCSALLLQETPDLQMCGPEIKGFGPDAAWPVFGKNVPSIDYTIVPAASTNAHILRDDGTTKPLCSGSIVVVKDGPRMSLVAQDDDRPIDVQVFEGEFEWDAVWAALLIKSVEYWPRQQNMPTLRWLPATVVKSALSGIDSEAKWMKRFHHIP